MDIPVFELSSFLHPGETFHLARVNIISRQDLSFHTHDYAELLWIEKGSGYHLVNGERLRIEPGDLIMIRPQDAHTYAASTKGGGITLINIAFPAETLHHFRERYFPDSSQYFWSTGAMPYRIQLPAEILHQLSASAEETMSHSRSNIELDSLLLFIFRQITLHEALATPADIPVWLVRAIQEYTTPDLFRRGCAGFAGLCGRNGDYVNRTVRLHFGKSLTELTNELKMRYAATQLIITSMPIKEISSNCGFPNLGHFYKTFKSLYNQTPKKYRRINQTMF